MSNASPAAPQPPEPMRPPYPYIDPNFRRDLGRTLAREAGKGCLRLVRASLVTLAALAVLCAGGLGLISLIYHAPAPAFVNPMPYFNQYAYVIHHGQTEVNGVSWSPDGKWVTSVGDDGSLQAWNASNGQTRWTYHAQRGTTIQLDWSPDGTRLALDDSANALVVLDSATGRTVFAVPAAHGGNSVAWSPDGHRIAAVTESGQVQVWDTANGQVLETLPGYGNDIAWSPNGRYLASSQNGLTVWDVALGQVVVQVKPENVIEVGGALAWSPDSQDIAEEVYGEEQVREQVWQVPSEHSIFKFSGSTPQAPELVATWSPDSRLLAIGGDRDDTVSIWNVASGSKLLTYNGHAEASIFDRQSSLPSSGGVRAIDWSRDGKYVVSLGDEDSVQIWDPATGATRANYYLYTSASLIHGGFATEGGRAIALSPNAQKVAIRGDKFAEVWQP